MPVICLNVLRRFHEGMEISIFNRISSKKCKFYFKFDLIIKTSILYISLCFLSIWCFIFSNYFNNAYCGPCRTSCFPIFFDRNRLVYLNAVCGMQIRGRSLICWTTMWYQFLFLFLSFSSPSCFSFPILFSLSQSILFLGKGFASPWYRCND